MLVVIDRVVAASSLVAGKHGFLERFDIKDIIDSRSGGRTAATNIRIVCVYLYVLVSQIRAVVAQEVMYPDHQITIFSMLYSLTFFLLPLFGRFKITLFCA